MITRGPGWALSTFTPTGRGAGSRGAAATAALLLPLSLLRRRALLLGSWAVAAAAAGAALGAGLALTEMGGMLIGGVCMDMTGIPSIPSLVDQLDLAPVDVLALVLVDGLLQVGVATEADDSAISLTHLLSLSHSAEWDGSTHGWHESCGRRRR